MNENSLNDKIRGSLIGGAIGDALGYPIEFKKNIKENEITRFVNDIAIISDDTQMTLFTVNGLIYHKFNNISHLPESVVYKAYLDWYNTQNNIKNDDGICWIRNISKLNVRRAPGNTCLSALSSGNCGTLENAINNSKGCGGIMRIAPVGLFYPYNEDEFKNICLLGARCSAITHGNILSHISSFIFTGIINLLTYTNSSIYDAVYKSSQLAVKTFSSNKDELNACISLILKSIELAHENKPDNEAIKELGEGWVAEETLAIAIYSCLKYNNDFEKAICCAINHDGDSDSTGAITGNIMGSYLGYNKIPNYYLEKLELKDLIEELSNDMIKLCNNSNLKEDEDLKKKYYLNNEKKFNNTKKIQKDVSEMLTKEIYSKLDKLHISSLNLTFFGKNDINQGQYGFRYNPIKDEVINDWAGNEYIIIGYDSTAGFGPEPYIIKIDEESLPIFWLMTDGGDWKHPTKIANSLDNFIKIINCLNNHIKSDKDIDKKSILQDISTINSKENMTYWNDLVEYRLSEFM